MKNDKILFFIKMNNEIQRLYNEVIEELEEIT